MDAVPATPPPADAHYPAGPADLIVVPLALAALLLAKAARGAGILLVRLLDILFPLLLQLMRFPLFTLRILGDAIVFVAKTVIRWSPLPRPRRQAWIIRLGEAWAWARKRISFHAFEEWVHHLFEGGMAWVFRTCRGLTPGTAVLVLVGAALWLPISFGIATAMHALLIAYAASLPPAMQLLHPLATVIAKSKLLVLPVYPAAWPQAKRHPLPQGLFALWRGFVDSHLLRRARVRYRQLDAGWTALASALRTAAARSGLTAAAGAAGRGLAAAALAVGRVLRDASVWVARHLTRLPLVGTALDHYAAHYARASAADSPHPPSHRVRDFFARWSIKFTAEYYEAADRAGPAAGRHPA
jgi:hypothetical protein